MTDQNKKIKTSGFLVIPGLKTHLKNQA